VVTMGKRGTSDPSAPLTALALDPRVSFRKEATWRALGATPPPEPEAASTYVTGCYGVAHHRTVGILDILE